MSTTDFAPTAHRLGLRAWLALVVSELKCVARDTAGLLIPLGLPALFLTMYGLGGGAESGSGDESTGASILDVFGIPLAVAMVLCLIGVVNMPSFLATYRRTGVLQRLSVTPVEPVHVLVAQVLVSVVQSAVGIGIAMGVAVIGFGARPQGSVLVFVGVVLLIAAAMYGIGMVVAAISPSPNSAVAIGMVGFFGMGATGGLFGPMDNLPAVMGEIGSRLPFGAGMEAVNAAWTGTGVSGGDLVALAVAAVLGLVVGVMTFRWDR
ncbi:ABC transporter permease [Aeromicrobium sp. CTD01-1L150]|uniref:ABC transporter permease n=1 Tax=Aeromicrobium sp. CTD01-1L150 TaxID=3341830 RepID=UPI0035C0034B